MQLFLRVDDPRHPHHPLPSTSAFCIPLYHPQVSTSAPLETAFLWWARPSNSTEYSYTYSTHTHRYSYELNSSLFNFPSFSIFFGEKNKIYCYLVGVQKKDLKQHQASFAPAGIHPDVPCLIQWRVEPGTTGTQLIHSIELKVCALAFSEDGRDR